MSDSQKNVSKDLVKIISQAVEKKIYGSVEVYFEAGNITQITQRIISKIRNHQQTSPADSQKNNHQKVESQEKLMPRN